jgi:site-specific DNA recombinase
MGRNSRNKANEIAAERKKAAIWRIAVYIRLSREDGNEESESITNQKKVLKEFLEQYFEGKFEIADFYIDDGLSGTDDTRADFMRMIQDIEQGEVNCVVCKTLSRAFRNYSDQGYYLEYYFPQKQVRFISTGDPKIDTYLNPEVITGLEVPITGLMNDRFAAKTSSDIRRTFNTKRRNGEFIGAFPPYGYLKSPENKNKLILDEDIVPIKRDILHWIVNEGMSLNGVAHRLNKLGIPNPSAYKRSKGWKYSNPKINENDGLWTGTTVRRIILDKVNLGHMIQGKQRVVSYKVHDKISVPEEEWFVKENTHEPTFTQEEYDTLARLLERDTRSPNGKRVVHMFAGFLKCKDCGKALHRKTAKDRVYYACRTYTEKSKDKCTKHSIRLDLLEKAVLAAIQAQITLIDSLSEIVDEINRAPVIDTQSKRIEKMLKEKQQDLEKLRRLSDSLYIDWKSGDINHEDYRRMKARFEEQISQTENTLLNLDEEQRRMGQGVDTDNSVFTDFLKHKNVTQLDRSLLVELVDTIYVHEEKEITIQFRFQDELKNILEFVETNTGQQKAN